jgi:hypothetical protein
MRVSSNALTFAIKPIPAGVDEARWLPASRLELQEQWSENPPKFVVGEPLTRTITIRAVGAVSAQLPVLEAGTHDGFKLYPDQPTLSDDKVNGVLQSAREQKIAIIPTRSGVFTLPPVEVQWWNTHENKLEVARLPERQVTVLPVSGKSDALAVLDTSGNSIANKTPSTVVPSNRWPRGVNGMWPWLTALCAVGWLSTLVFWWLHSRAKSHADHRKIVEAQSMESLRRLRHNIKVSCDSNDAHAVRPQLLTWATQRWQDNSINSLTAIARRSNPAFAKALLDLDRSLYSTTPGVWKGAALWEAFDRSTLPMQINESSSALRPLYEHAQ